MKMVFNAPFLLHAHFISLSLILILFFFAILMFYTFFYCWILIFIKNCMCFLLFFRLLRWKCRSCFKSTMFRNIKRFFYLLWDVTVLWTVSILHCSIHSSIIFIHVPCNKLNVFEFIILKFNILRISFTFLFLFF